DRALFDSSLRKVQAPAISAARSHAKFLAVTDSPLPGSFGRHAVVSGCHGAKPMAQEIGSRLGEHFDHFIEQQLAEGRFGSRDEVLQTALQLLEEREARLAKLRDVFQREERAHE